MHVWLFFTIYDSLISSSCLKSAIKIMNITMQYFFRHLASYYVTQIFRHSNFRSTKNWGLIHIVPNMEESICTIKKVVRIKGAPVVSSSFIHKVDPNTTSRPAVTYEVLLVRRLDKYIGADNPIRISSPVNLKSILVHGVCFLILDVRVCYYYEPPVWYINHRLHQCQIILIEIEWMKLEIFAL